MKCYLLADGKDEGDCCFAKKKKKHTRNTTYLLLSLLLLLLKKEKTFQNGGVIPGGEGAPYMVGYINTVNPCISAWGAYFKSRKLKIEVGPRLFNFSLSWPEMIIFVIHYLRANNNISCLSTKVDPNFKSRHC